MDIKDIESKLRTIVAENLYIDARATFEAHANFYKPDQLRFLQYVTKDTRAWWEARQSQGAVLL